MIKRIQSAALRNRLRAFPVVLVLGPRQAGKTTLVQSALAKWEYVDLERARDVQAIAGDVEGFLENRRSVVFDEAQRLPQLFPALRSLVDRRKGAKGQFVLTGSARLSLRQMAGESLAGRAGTVELTPFLVEELAARPAWLRERWFWGGYPPLYHLRSAREKIDWLESYIDSFLDTDLPGLGIRVPSLRLRRFWTMLAHCHGGLLNASEIGRSLAQSHHTIMDYLDILEQAFVIRRLPPFYANVGKRLAKSPKVYVRDSGLLHRLLGLASPRDLESHPKQGASWEGFVIEELIERFRARFPGSKFYFWHTHAGGEVDLLMEFGTKILPIEIKAGHSIDSRSLAGLRTALTDLGAPRGFVIYRGAQRIKVTRNIELIPWRSLERGGLPI